MKKVICIADSTALPGHSNKYEDTWIYKSQEAYKNIAFITLFKRAITTNILNEEGGGDILPMGADCLEHYNPDVVILQLGIVDCAPRLMRSNGLERKIVARLPKILRELYVNILKKIRGRSEKRVDVPVEQFRANLEKYLLRCAKNGVEKVIVIGIPYPSEKMTALNPLITKMVDQYNSVYKSLSHEFSLLHVIFPLDSRKYGSEIFEDGYHPNPIGNDLVFKELEEYLI